MAKHRKLMVVCDGCGKKFDASDYDNISSRHPHYNLALVKLLDKRGEYHPRVQ